MSPKNKKAEHPELLEKNIELWLDDERNPEFYLRSNDVKYKWTWVKTAEDAIFILEGGHVVHASLDHDLGLVNGPTKKDGTRTTLIDTGYSVVCWLEQHPEFWPPQGVSVHSQNPVGKAKMDKVIERHYGKIFLPLKFGWA